MCCDSSKSGLHRKSNSGNISFDTMWLPIWNEKHQDPWDTLVGHDFLFEMSDEEPS